MPHKTQKLTGYGRVDVIEEPVPHILLKPKQIKGRWTDRDHIVPRQCIPDFIHLDPYGGCDTNCSFCCLPSRGHHRIEDDRGRRVFVAYKDYPDYVREKVSEIRLAHIFDLTASSDPFMALESLYGYSEKCINVLADMNLPVTVTTKRVVPDGVLDALSRNEYSWIQFSVVARNEEIRKALMPGGASYDEIEDNIRRAKDAGLYVTVRLQPFIPDVTEDELMSNLADEGVDHFIIGFLRIPHFIGKKYYKQIKKATGIDIEHLYTENMPGYKVANSKYRMKALADMRKMADNCGCSFAVCEEYFTEGGDALNLQPRFCSVASCEGRSVPIHVRMGEALKFTPLPERVCDGNCLNCSEEKARNGCRVPEFAQTGKWNLTHYAKFSKRWK